MTQDDLLESNKDLLAFCTDVCSSADQSSEESIMVEFDPGPPPDVADHLAGVPSYRAHRDLFWYDWGPIFYRGRLDDRPSCSASPPTPGRPSGSPAARWSATRASASRASSPSWA